MTDITSAENELPTDGSAYGVIGAWAQGTERFLMNKLVSGRRSITLTRAEAERMVVALGEIAAIGSEMDDLSAALEEI